MLRYDGSSVSAFLNGSRVLDANHTSGMRSSEYKLTLGGGNNFSGTASNLNFSEFLVFENALSDSNISLLEGYLAHKWDLSASLNNDHPFKSEAPEYLQDSNQSKYFLIDENGTLSLNKTFDYETDDQNFSFRVNASDDQNAITSKQFVFKLLNVGEPPVIQSSASINLNFVEDGGTFEFNYWDRNFGGSLSDKPHKIIPSHNGSYLIIGQSDSNKSGDHYDETYGSTDGWVVKVEDNGTKVWDKSYGGTSQDFLYDGVLTDDGGYLLAGYSESNVSGEKSQNSKGGYDYWVVKIDGHGNKIWDKSFGGDKNDCLRAITKADDGGYLLVGTSDSNAIGDKTHPTQGGTDYWALKIDVNGTKIWDKSYGGSGSESLYSHCVTKSPEGGFLIAGKFTFTAFWQ